MVVSKHVIGFEKCVELQSRTLTFELEKGSERLLKKYEKTCSATSVCLDHGLLPFFACGTSAILLLKLMLSVSHDQMGHWYIQFPIFTESDRVMLDCSSTWMINDLCLYIDLNQVSNGLASSRHS
jgi:hypothetical protein